jgi:8-oxo-dGTP pyrophosphatase MutT (NUDIX family)
MSKNYYHSEPHRPFHLSVGLVIVDDKGNFLSKHFSDFRGHYQNLYLFPTETVEEDESLEATMQRALIEEVGVTARPLGYIGSITGTIPRHELAAEKTTVYFLMQYTGQGEGPLYPLEDGHSSIEWYTADFLKEQYAKQPKELLASVLNETKMVNAAETFLNTKTP